MPSSPSSPTDRGFAGDAQRVLVLAPFARDAAEIGRVLVAADFCVAACRDVQQLCAGIEQGAGAVLVAEEALSDQARGRIADILADQPSWSDLPLLIMKSVSRRKHDGWHTLRGFENIAQVRLLERPLTTAALVSTIRAAVGSRRRQYQMRDELAIRQRTEATVRRQQELSDALNRINAAVHETLDRDAILQALMVEGITALGCETAAVSLRRATHWTLHCLRGLPDELLGAVISDQQDRHALLALQSRTPIAIEDAWNDPRVNLEHLRRHNIRAVLVVPLFVRESPLGAAFFNCHGGPRPFSEAEMAFAKQLSATASIALENVRLFNEHRQAEEELLTLNETLEERIAERTAVAERRAADLRRLAAKLTDAEHRERRRLAKLLHDDLQQLLLAAKLRLPLLLEDQPSELQRHVDKIDELVADCLSTSRNLTQELSPPVLEHGSLAETLVWLAGWFGEKHGLTVELNVGKAIPPAPECVRLFLFAAVRELLFNVVKHSGTRQAHVGLSWLPKGFVVQVEDEGAGFNPVAVKARLQYPEGFGLFNIRERLEALGGRLEIDKSPSGGAGFRLFVPAKRGEGGQPELAVEERTRTKVRHSRPEVIRLLVVDDHEVVREGMVGLLDREQGLEVVGQAAEGWQAVAQVESLHPDAVIMDVDMPGMNGIDATREIKRRGAETVVVGLSMHDDDGVRRAMVDAGADGYISKQAPARELVAAIRHLCS